MHRIFFFIVQIFSILIELDNSWIVNMFGHRVYSDLFLRYRDGLRFCLLIIAQPGRFVRWNYVYWLLEKERSLCFINCD